MSLFYSWKNLDSQGESDLPASCGRAAWNLALQSAMEKRIALTEGQFFSFSLGMELTEVQQGWACPGHFTAACLLQPYCFLPHLRDPKFVYKVRREERFFSQA